MIVTPTSIIHGDKIKPAPGAERLVYAVTALQRRLDPSHPHHRIASSRLPQPHDSRHNHNALADQRSSAIAISTGESKALASRVTPFAKRLALNKDSSSGSYLAERQILRS